MAEDDQVVEILTRVRTDPASEQAAKMLRQIQDTLERLRAANKDVAAEQAKTFGANDALNMWAKHYTKVREEAERLNATLRETKRVQEEAARAPAPKGGGGKNDAAGATSLFQSEGFRQAQISRAILYGGFSIPGDLGRGITSIFGALSSLQEVDARFKQLKETSGGLGNVLKEVALPAGLAAAGIGIVILALKSLDETTRGAATALEGTLAAFNKFYSEINALTKEEAENRAATLRLTIEGQKEGLAILESQYAAQRDPRGGAPTIEIGGQQVVLQFLQEIRAIIGSAAPSGLGSSLGQMEAAIDTAKKALAENETQLNNYTNAVNNNRTALQDAAQAAEAYFNELTEGGKQAIADQKLIRSGNVDSAKEQIQTLKDTTKTNNDILIKAAEELNAVLPAPFKQIATAFGRGDIVQNISQLTRQFGVDLPPAARLLIDRMLDLNKTILDDSNQVANLENNILPLVEARRKELDAIKAAEKAAEQNARNFEKLAQIQEDIDKAQADRARQLERQREDQRIQDERDAITKDFEGRIEAAKEEERQQGIYDNIERLKADNATEEINAQAELDREIARINNDYMADAAEAWAKFYASELNRIKDNNDRRLKLLEDGAFTLRQLASKRQVAEFIAAQKQLELRLRQLDRDNDEETRRRQAAFLGQRQAEEDDRAKRIAALRESFLVEQTLRRNQLAQQIADELNGLILRRTRSQQLEEQFAAIREQWQIQDQQRRLAYEAIDYQNRINLMRQKQSEILAEIFNFYAQQQSAFGNIVSVVNNALMTTQVLLNQIRAAMNQAQSYTPTYSAPYQTQYSPYQNTYSGPVYTPPPPPPPPSPSIAATYATVFPTTLTASSQQGAYNPYTQASRGRFFAAGSGMMDIPYDNYAAVLHKDERVLNAMEARNYGSRGMGTFVLNLTTTDVASKANIREAADYLHSEWRQATRGVR